MEAPILTWTAPGRFRFHAERETDENMKYPAQAVAVGSLKTWT